MAKYKCQNGHIFENSRDIVSIIMPNGGIRNTAMCFDCMEMYLKERNYTKIEEPSFEMKVNTFYRCRKGWKAGCFWKHGSLLFEIIADNGGVHVTYSVNEYGKCTLRDSEEYDIIDYWEEE